MTTKQAKKLANYREESDTAPFEQCSKCWFWRGKQHVGFRDGVIDWFLKSAPQFTIKRNVISSHDTVYVAHVWHTPFVA